MQVNVYLRGSGVTEVWLTPRCANRSSEVTEVTEVWLRHAARTEVTAVT
ncbi:hypothetical protein B6N60_00693 [Richelia sinica FACHB-800]|uniref:Uncharacterized protein n=1 Tax=Richelia sinica FACHB-800 TaxID=1357546 RepID=A0A975T4M7_9NOST|nr:hypothetical protein [Richelia sinica]MBD2663141.1 hypothetical protein [Richelia sinica FACHB-800]QXE22015.1 hypothetical protein B6N60_00693 [Richelia sinica FACHB-800]